jgi:prepilin signal peptidase PulO-like enzyme (type II secretory pathway)
MDVYMVYIFLTVLGLILGSFVSASVWRLHEQGKSKSKKFTKALSISRGRSMCPACHHVLAASDLVPVFSWLWLRGKCRYCNQPIGIREPVIELSLAVFFDISYAFWPRAMHGIGLFEFILWLIFVSGVLALAIYDIRWGLLPNKVVYPLIVLGICQVLTLSIVFRGGLGTLSDAFWGVVVGGGIFYLLFQLSNGRWIGGGDVKLGGLLGLLVGGALPAFLLLFLASCLGTLYALPQLSRGRLKANSRIPFGPFLLFAGLLVRLFGAGLIMWYKKQII